MRGRSLGKERQMRVVTVRETVVVPVTPPVPWRREINMPPKNWFRGEWLPARLEREAKEREAERRETARKWRRLIFGTFAGIALIGGSMAAYFGMLVLVGTP